MQFLFWHVLQLSAGTEQARVNIRYELVLQTPTKSDSALGLGRMWTMQTCDCGIIWLHLLMWCGMHMPRADLSLAASITCCMLAVQVLGRVQ